MISGLEIKGLLQRQPFHPFRVTLSSGETYDVTHHDATWVTRHTLEVGLNVDPNGLAEYVRRCSILHITSIADLEPATTPKRRTGRKSA